MRYLLGAVIVATFPALTTAQQQPAQNPPPSIGLPLPPIGLPLPRIGLDPLGQPQPGNPPQPPSPVARPHLARPAFIFFGAPYAFGVDPALQSRTPGEIVPVPKEPPPPATGLVRLEIEPAELAQVFVDGEYVGTPADLESGLELEAGTRRIEIRARGYETLTVDVRVVAGRAITFRETLDKAGGAGKAGEAGGMAGKESAAIRPAEAAPPTSPTSPTRPKSTFYLIPGCYLGNVPPEQLKLPASCDFSRMITHTP